MHLYIIANLFNQPFNYIYEKGYPCYLGQVIFFTITKYPLKTMLKSSV